MSGPVEQAPTVVGAITLVAGGALLAAPQVYTQRAGMPDQALGVRAVGLADLLLVPGLLRGRPRWPWMVGRSAVSLMQATYLHGVTARSSSPGVVRASAATLLGLAATDLATALALRRAGV